MLALLGVGQGLLWASGCWCHQAREEDLTEKLSPCTCSVTPRGSGSGGSWTGPPKTSAHQCGALPWEVSVQHCFCWWPGLTRCWKQMSMVNVPQKVGFWKTGFSPERRVRSISILHSQWTKVSISRELFTLLFSGQSEWLSSCLHGFLR